MFLAGLAGLAGGAAAGMSGLGLAATIGSTVLGAGGAIMQGIAGSQQAEYAATVAQNNATLARQAADAEERRGTEEARQNDMKTKALLAAQKSQQAASGFDINSGTPLDVREGSSMLGRVDTLQTKRNSDTKVVNFQNQAIQYDNDAEVARARGGNSMLQGFLGAASSVLGGVSSYADKWASYRRAGY